jgi:hypothetical protein
MECEATRPEVFGKLWPAGTSGTLQRVSLSGPAEGGAVAGDTGKALRADCAGPKLWLSSHGDNRIAGLVPCSLRSLHAAVILRSSS